MQTTDMNSVDRAEKPEHLIFEPFTVTMTRWRVQTKRVVGDTHCRQLVHRVAFLATGEQLRCQHSRAGPLLELGLAGDLRGFVSLDLRKPDQVLWPTAPIAGDLF